jgi:biotin operon repressor
MTMPEPSLRQELMEARTKVQRQIDRLRELPRPLATVGEQGLDIFSVDNSYLITKLTGILRELDESLAGLGPSRT